MKLSPVMRVACAYLYITDVDDRIMDFNLLPKAKTQKAEEFFCGALGNEEDLENVIQTSHNYNTLGCLFVHHEKYRLAHKAFTRAIELKEPFQVSDGLLFNFSYVSVLTGDAGENHVKNLKKCVDGLSSNQLNARLVKEFYQFALAQSNDPNHQAELQQILLSRQQEILDKCREKQKKLAQQLASRRVSNTTMHTPQTTSQQTSRRKKIQLQPATETDSVSLWEKASQEKTMTGRNYIPTQGKEKEKTKGTPDPEKGLALEATQEPTLNRLEPIYIEEIITNKNAIKIFNKLFLFHPRKPCFYDKVDISLHEIHSLFKALEQNWDTSQGKGSHKKGTLNFQEVGSTMDEQVVILTKSAKLKPYQIKALRAAFSQAHVVPHDEEVIKKLKEEGVF